MAGSACRVRIVQLLRRSPSGDLQFSHSPAKARDRPSRALMKCGILPPSRDSHS